MRSAKSMVLLCCGLLLWSADHGTHQVRATGDSPPTLKDDEKRLQGTWVNNKPEGNKEGFTLGIIIQPKGKALMLTQQWRTKNFWGSGGCSWNYELVESNGKRMIALSDGGKEAARLSYKFKGDTLVLEDDKRLRDKLGYSHKGEWSRKKDKE